MTKKRSKKLFILFAILTAILMIISYISFPILIKIDGVRYNYNSFFAQINYGFDVFGGTVLEYTCDLPDGEEQDNYEDYRNSVVTTFNLVLDSMRFYNSEVTKVGDDKIRVEVVSKQDAKSVNSIINLFKNPELMLFKTEQSDTAESFLTGRDVKKVELANKSEYGIYGVIIYFENEFVDTLKQNTTDVSQIFIYLGGSAIQYSIQDAITNGAIGLYSDAFITRESTLSLHAQVLLGTLKLDCTTINSGAITAGLGFNIGTYLIIGLLLLLVLTFVFMYLKYKDLSLLTLLSMFIYMALTAIIIQSIPFMRLNLMGVVAALVMFIITLDAHCQIMDNIKKHYLSGKKLNACYRLGYNSKFMPTITAFCATFVAGGLMALMPIAAIKSLGMVIFACSPVALICVTLLFKLFLKMYEPINPDKPSKINLSDVEVSEHV